LDSRRGNETSTLLSRWEIPPRRRGGGRRIVRSCPESSRSAHRGSVRWKTGVTPRRGRAPGAHVPRAPDHVPGPPRTLLRKKSDNKARVADWGQPGARPRVASSRSTDLLRRVRGWLPGHPRLLHLVTSACFRGGLARRSRSRRPLLQEPFSASPVSSPFLSPRTSRMGQGVHWCSRSSLSSSSPYLQSSVALRVSDAMHMIDGSQRHLLRNS